MEKAIKPPKDDSSMTKSQRFFNGVKAYCKKPSNIILIAFATLLTLTVIVPLIFLLYNTIIVHQGEAS